MGETDLRLDANALAGALEDVFRRDVTVAPGECAHCGHVAPLGAQHLYRSPRSPGAVVRCAACDGLLLVLVARRDGYVLSLSGFRWISP
jgi:hypothetical protein